MKNVYIVTGPVGIGVSKIAFNAAKSLCNIDVNTEIVLFDHIKLFKELNLFADKPSEKYLNEIKYHNLNEISLSDGCIMNCAVFATRTRQKLVELLNKNINPLIQGGSYFYINTLISGGSNFLSEEEYLKYYQARLIAKSIIEFDKHNFDRTILRLERKDKSFIREFVPENDFYRLEKKYADYIFLGKGFYRKRILMDMENREKNFLYEVNFKKIMLYMKGDFLIRKLQEKCIKLIKEGIVIEIIRLIKEDLITPDQFYYLQNPLRTSYGISEAIDFLIQIGKIYPEKEIYLKSLNRENYELFTYRKHLYTIFGNFLEFFVKGLYHYASKQMNMFRKDPNSCLLEIKENQDNEEISEKINEIYQLNYLDLGKYSKNKKNDDIFCKDQIKYEQYDKLIAISNLSNILNTIFDEFESIKQKISIFEKVKNGDRMKEKLLNYMEIRDYL